MAYPTDLNPTLKTDWANNTPVEDTHPEEHNDVASNVEALKAKVGADGSAVTTSHDYKLSEVTTTDKAVGKTATQTLTNKTLTAPKIASGGFIADANGNEQIEMTTTASATNHIGTTNAATGNDPIVETKGSDTNISLRIRGKGTGTVKLGNAALQFPNSDGSNTQVLQTNGAGVLSFVTPSSGVATATTIMPMPAFPFDNPSDIGYSTNTSMRFGLVDIPQTITVNKITVRVGAYTSSGTLKLALFSQDGGTKIFEVTTATISSGSQLVTTAVSAVTVTAGQYYIAAVPTGTSNFGLQTYDSTGFYTNFLVVSGEKYLSGVKTVTAGTIPSTFDPTTSVTNDQYATIQVRLDN